MATRKQRISRRRKVKGGWTVKPKKAKGYNTKKRR